MNTLRLFLLFLLPLASRLAPAAFAAVSPAEASAKAGTRVYACSMHPWIKSDKPGKCTICGMDLALTSAAAADAPAGVVALSPSVLSTIGVETSTIARQPLTRTLRVTGRIDDDDTRHRVLSARVPGRVEQLHVNFLGAPVAAGAPLATIYSPEMLGAQRVFVERMKAGAAFSVADRSAAREKLFELGLTETDLAALEQKQEPSATVVVRAPGAGTVVAKAVYEGQYVKTDDRLFEIADFSRMWFVFDAYPQDIPWLHVGQTVEITTRAVPGETITAPIEFIDPNFDETRQTTRVRAVLPNPHYSVDGAPHTLPHRVLAEGRVLVESPAVLAAPRSAVLDRGTGPLAFVDRGGGHYEQRALKLGRRGDGLAEILSGLSEGEKVVTNGALFIDAQAQLANVSAPHAPSTGTTAAAPPANTDADAAVASGASPEETSRLQTLASAAVEAAAALAADDFARYQKTFPALGAAAKEFPNLPKLEVGANLKAARASFEPWSTQVADLLKPHRAALGLKVFQCPMAPVLGKGRWVQRAQPLKNPFFGSAMADCGEEVP